MSFETASKTLIEQTIKNNSDIFPILLNTNTTIIEVFDDRRGSGYIHLRFTLSNHSLNIYYEYIFKRNPNNTPDILDTLVDISKISFKIKPQIDKEVNEFDQTIRLTLLNVYDQLYK